MAMYQRRSKHAAAAAILVILILAAVVSLRPAGTVEYDLDSDAVGYIVCYTRGLGPRRLEYSENREVIDDLCRMLSGKYAYVKTWRDTGRDGGGVSRIDFFDPNGNEIQTVYYLDGRICIKGRLKGSYYLYRHTENILDLTALEDALR